MRPNPLPTQPQFAVLPPRPAGTHPLPSAFDVQRYNAALSTSRAKGAAALPPAPAPTSITATTTFGALAGANATNHASVFFGSGGPLAVGRSSAVPVLPGTSSPGSAAAVPVPERTTQTIMPRSSSPVLRETARLRMTLSFL